MRMYKEKEDFTFLVGKQTAKAQRTLRGEKQKLFGNHSRFVNDRNFELSRSF